MIYKTSPNIELFNEQDKYYAVHKLTGNVMELTYKMREVLEFLTPGKNEEQLKIFLQEVKAIDMDIDTLYEIVLKTLKDKELIEEK